MNLGMESDGMWFEMVSVLELINELLGKKCSETKKFPEKKGLDSPLKYFFTLKNMLIVFCLV